MSAPSSVCSTRRASCCEDPSARTSRRSDPPCGSTIPFRRSPSKCPSVTVNTRRLPAGVLPTSITGSKVILIVNKGRDRRSCIESSPRFRGRTAFRFLLPMRAKKGTNEALLPHSREFYEPCHIPSCCHRRTLRATHPMYFLHGDDAHDESVTNGNRRSRERTKRSAHHENNDLSRRPE